MMGLIFTFGNVLAVLSKDATRIQFQHFALCTSMHAKSNILPRPAILLLMSQTGNFNKF